MKTVDKLIGLMKAKNKVINGLVKENKEEWPKGVKKYFLKADEEDLRTLSERKASRIWKQVVKNVDAIEFIGLGSETCPFCLWVTKKGRDSYYIECGTCGYGKRHRKCDSYDTIICDDIDTYSFVRGVFLKFGIDTVLTEKWYKVLIQTLNSEK